LLSPDIRESSSGSVFGVTGERSANVRICLPAKHQSVTGTLATEQGNQVKSGKTRQLQDLVFLMFGPRHRFFPLSGSSVLGPRIRFCVGSRISLIVGARHRRARLRRNVSRYR
jgi:hypothetical protein